MKFLPVALLSLLIGADAAHKKRRLDTQKLLRSAIPANKDGTVRKLEQQNAGQILTAAHSIQFNQCLSLKIQPADEDVAFGEDYIGYTKAGQIVPQKSYILFNICETQYCVYQGDDNLYMVDVDTYMQAFVEYLPNKRESYCQACEEAQDVCVQDEEEEAEQEQEEGQEEEENNEEENNEGEEGEEEGQEEEEGGRRLQNNQYAVEVSCETCISKGCYQDNDEDNDGQDDDMEIANWAAELAQCQQTDYMFDDETALYAGFMCNSAGNGVEIALFLDEDCETYTTLKSYKNLVNGQEEQGYLYNSQEIVTYPFLNDIPCAPVEYYYNDGEQDNQDENQNDNGEEEIAEVCQNLLQNNENEWVYNINDCDANGQQDEQDEEEAEENQEADQDDNYQWYSYMLSQEDLENGDMKACQVIQALEGEYKELHIYNGSEENGSGEFYDYGVQRKSGLSGGGIFGIVLLVLVVVGAIVYVATSSAKKKDSKKQPLVGRNNGAMA